MDDEHVLAATVCLLPEQVGILACVVLVPKVVYACIHDCLSLVGSSLVVAIIHGSTHLHGTGSALGDTAIVGVIPLLRKRSDSLIKVCHCLGVNILA